MLGHSINVNHPVPKDRADPTATHIARVRRAHRMTVADHVKVPPRCAAISATADVNALNFDFDFDTQLPLLDLMQARLTCPYILRITTRP